MSNDLDVLVIDHYDSFTHNLVDDAVLAERPEGGSYLDEKPDVRYYDETSVEEILEEGYEAIVISPGPGNPENEEDIAPTDEILREISPEIPTLGVCLGMEGMATAYGGSVSKAPEPVHGKAYEVTHDEEGVFEDLDNPLQGGRYHSLVVDDIPDCLEQTAETQQEDEEIVMGLRHKEDPIYGVQFHPESILTGGGQQAGNRRYGPEIVGNFFEIVEEYHQNTNKEKQGEF